MDIEFKKFPKIPRNSNLSVIITEKIDGTNAQIYVTEDGRILAGSRTRWISRMSDNYGFAAWVDDNAAALLKRLPAGRYYGEWWGAGIQRKYGMKWKYFTPFDGRVFEMLDGMEGVKALPVIYEGAWREDIIERSLQRLHYDGSRVAPGFMNPEGVVAYFPELRVGMKETFEGAKWKEGVA